VTDIDAAFSDKASSAKKRNKIEEVANMAARLPDIQRRNSQSCSIRQTRMCDVMVSGAE